MHGRHRLVWRTVSAKYARDSFGDSSALRAVDCTRTGSQPGRVAVGLGMPERPLGPPVDFDENEAREHLAGLVQHFAGKARDTGERRFAAALALLRVARWVLDGTLQADATMAVIAQKWNDATIYPASKSHEFSALGDIVGHLLSCKQDHSEVPKVEDRAAVMAGFVTNAISERVAVSLWIREFATSDWRNKLPAVREKTREILESVTEARWPTARAKICREALRAVGVPNDRLKNDDFEPRPESQ